jgi:hypothetical protein
MNLKLPTNHHLHEISMARIKRKSDYALKVATTLYKYKAHLSFKDTGKVPRRQLSAMVGAWSKESKTKALTLKQGALKAAFKEERDMDGDYEDLAWRYFGNDNHDGRPRENIFLMRFKKRTLRQVFNLLRSKLVFESRLQKTDGKTTLMERLQKTDGIQHALYQWGCWRGGTVGVCTPSYQLAPFVWQ